MTRIKICGFTQKDDAYRAIDTGVDSLGFVFYQNSKRFVSPKQVTWINQLPAFVQITGLFVNPNDDDVKKICEHLNIDLLQFHGNETADFCQKISHHLKKRYIKAVPMQSLTTKNVNQYTKQYIDSCGFLLDNYGQTNIGGSGTSFNWGKIPKFIHAPLILAGGLNTSNIKHILSTYNPYAVDISSSIEQSPGIKSTKKMIEFIRIVKNYDINLLENTHNASR